MRKPITTAAGFLFLLLFFSGKTLKPRKTPPPNTVFLKEGLYIDIAPITNRDYLEFLDFCKSANWEKCFTDEEHIPQYGLTWDSLGSQLRSCPSDYSFLKRFVPADSVIEIYTKDVMHKKVINPFKYSEYNTHPIVNISYEQAQKFCEWRSKVVMYRIAIDSKTPEERAKKHFKKIKYRLPSKEEWELALKTFCGKIKLEKRIFTEGHPLTLPAPASKKFVYTPYSIAEMLSEKGKCEGLSYKDIALTDMYTSQNYEGPQPWLGFRCVCEVEE